MSETTTLVVIQPTTLPTILAADNKDILGKLKAELEGWEGDVTTPQGRAEIASKAHKVATAKMDLIRLGKSLTEGWRTSTKAVNDECKIIEERMNALRDQIRAPLDEYQAVEEARVKANNDALAAMEALTVGVDVLGSDEIAARADALQPFDWSFEFRARGAKARPA